MTTSNILSQLGSPGVSTGFKNRLINGNMVVGQRGSVTFSSTNNLYGWVDRWLVSISGSTVSALGYQASGFTSGANATTSGYALQIGNLLTTGATTAAVSQRIEASNCSDLNATTITFSGKVQQNTGSAQTLTIGVNKATAGVNNWGTQSVIGSTTISVPSSTAGTTWTPFSYTLTLGATDAVNGIAAVLAYNSLGAQSTTQFYFADCQLEVGTTATNFDTRDYGSELLRCQRYYYRAVCNNYSCIANGIAYSTTLFLGAYQFAVPMRTNPTLTYSALGDFAVITPGAGSAPTALSFDSTTANCARWNAGGSWAAGAAYIQGQNSSAWLAMSAEL